MSCSNLPRKDVSDCRHEFIWFRLVRHFALLILLFSDCHLVLASTSSGAAQDGLFLSNPPLDTTSSMFSPTDTSPNEFPRMLKTCWEGTKEINAKAGTIYLTHDGDYPVTLEDCAWRITVPEGHFVELEYEVIPDNCVDDLLLVNALDPLEIGSIGSYYCHDTDLLDQLSLSSSNSVEVLLSSSSFFWGFSKLLHNVTLFKIHFRMTDIDGRSKLAAVFTSPSAGYITSAGYVDSGRKRSFLLVSTYPAGIRPTYNLLVPDNHVVMVSLAHLDLDSFVENERFGRISDSLAILELHGNSSFPILTLTGREPLTAHVFNTSLRFHLDASLYSKGGTGVKILFSFHPEFEAPVKVSSGLFDCSVPHYASFQQHLACNLQLECEGGRDEDNCPFSSPLCNGSVALYSKCYRYVENPSVLSWNQADRQCKALGGQLAVMSSTQEQDALRAIFTHGRKWAPVYVGLQRVDLTVMPEMYRKMWMWNDRTMAYSADISYRALRENFEYGCGVFSPRLSHCFLAVPCSLTTEPVMHFVCEIAVKNDETLVSTNETRWKLSASGEFPSSKLGFTLPRSPQVQENSTPSTITQLSVVFPNLTNIGNSSEHLSALNLTMHACPDGHMTHSFLSCDSLADCGAQERTMTCPFLIKHHSTGVGFNIVSDDVKQDDAANGDKIAVAMFMCENGRTTIPHTLVCDYKLDCSDGSDEDFCDHGDKCPEFTCATRQCLTQNQRCDGAKQCWDGSDEDGCPAISGKDFFLRASILEDDYLGIVRRQPAPSVVWFDGRGNFSQTMLAPSQPCPDTHFACVSDPPHCLPVYLRCNGVFDCRGREDEMDCDQYTCPEYYRCRGSSVCVHADHLCDGWAQCPQRDDEAYCAMACPQQCHCQALAFVCPRPFPAITFPHLRYLDATGSGMTLKDLTNHRYLIWVRLASCNLSALAVPTLPNLQHVDVSDNQLTSVSVDLLLVVASLRVLRLAGNPLLALADPHPSHAKHQALLSLDLSRTALQRFDSQVLASFPQIRRLNMSHSALNEIGAGGFRFLPALTELDVRGSPLEDFPRDVFSGLSELKTIFSDNYKLCCGDTLPDTFDARFCLAPQDDISSCQDLLRSNVYRACLWLFAALALLGNVGCLLFRFLSEERKSKLGFNVFVTNLGLADCLMGVYLVIVGVADELYRGQYVWQEKAWRRSSACQTAGFLFLLSSEMSAFIICLITLDRFIVLRFPFSTFRFRRMSAALACGMIWLLGLLLAVVPVLPVTSDWQFFGQTGICIPLPITRKSFQGQDYAFAVIIVLNFVLFLLVAAGQMFIYFSIRLSHVTVTDTAQKSRDLVIARRFFAVAVSDFLCWFPIGLLGILASIGTPVPSEVNVGMAIFVLPLNSALNPFLYTFNVLTERKKKEDEERLLKLVQSRVASKKTESSKTS